jgi:hypothetical protein
MRGIAGISILVLAGMLTACSGAKPIETFAGTGPDFDPVAFWTGRSHSRGVLENRSGEPTEVVRTDCIGEPEGADGLHMTQTLTMGDGSTQSRDWHMRRSGPGRFTATANDMVGTAEGVAAGPAFHWTWTLATKPGNALFNVSMDQWMMLMDDGAMVNRTIISKLGVTLAQVTEQFERAK